MTPYPTLVVFKIISGGQTGADRAALDVAIRHGFPHGGWCPKGRKAEDGPIGGQYQLTETHSANYLQRTEWNVRDSDATVIFTLGPELSGGSLKTAEFAKKHQKLWLHLPYRGGTYLPTSEEKLQEFLTRHQIRVLNVAGSRESKAPGIRSWTASVLEETLFWSLNHPGELGGPGEG